MDMEIKREYHENGLIKSEHQEIPSGNKFNGIHFGYYDNGSKKYKNSWINDSLYGIFQFWHKNDSRHVLQQFSGFLVEHSMKGVHGLKIEFKY